MAVQPDGRILIGGTFTMVAGYTENRIARLNPDGTIDTSFISSGGANNAVSSLAVQNDGRIVMVGAFSMVGTQFRDRIARLLPDGSDDASFGSFSVGTGSILKVFIRSDGRIVVGGLFSPPERIADVDPASGAVGSYGAGASSDVYDFAEDGTGRLIAGGAFTTFDGAGWSRIARALPTNKSDGTFNPGTGANAGVRAVGVLPDGRIIIAGDFTTYNGVPRPRVAVIHGD